MSASGSLILVDDRDTSSIVYETPNLWVAPSESYDYAVDGTLTGGYSGAQASFGFTGESSDMTVFSFSTDVCRRFRHRRHRDRHYC